MTLQSILQKGREEFEKKSNSYSVEKVGCEIHAQAVFHPAGHEVKTFHIREDNLDSFIARHQSEILEGVVEMAGEIKKEQDGKMTMKFEDGQEADIQLHSDIALGYNQALTDIIFELKKVK